MIAFEVRDMTCGHCVATITKAVKAVDPAAQVRIDLPTHRVQIEGMTVDATKLGQAIADAGYAPVRVNAP